jgi:hypothetical protein
MRDHFEETGHKPTTRVVCQCGKRFSGGTSSGYRFHRFVFQYNVPVADPVHGSGSFFAPGSVKFIFFLTLF